MKISKELYEQIKGAHASMLDERGHEIPDPTPMALKVGMTRPATLQEQIQRLIKTTLSQQAEAQNMESFIEANDFDVTDDFETNEPMTKYNMMEEEFLEIPEKIENQLPLPLSPDDGDDGSAGAEEAGENP